MKGTTPIFAKKKIVSAHKYGWHVFEMGLICLDTSNTIPASVLYGSNNHRIPHHVLATCLLEFAKGHTAVWLSKLKGIAAWDWSLQMFGDSSMRNSQTKQNTSWKSGTSIFCCCLCNNIISLGFFQRTPPKSLWIAWEREEVNNIDSSSAQSFAFWPWIKVNGHSKWRNLKYLIRLTQFYWIGLWIYLENWIIDDQKYRQSTQKLIDRASLFKIAFVVPISKYLFTKDTMGHKF